MQILSIIVVSPMYSCQSNVTFGAIYGQPEAYAGAANASSFCATQAVTLDRLLLESEAAPKVHPEVLRLGLKYADGSISGGNARCLAMLHAFSLVIEVRALSCSMLVILHCHLRHDCARASYLVNALHTLLDAAGVRGKLLSCSRQDLKSAHDLFEGGCST